MGKKLVYPTFLFASFKINKLPGLFNGIWFFCMISLGAFELPAQEPICSSTISQNAPGGYYITGKLSFPKTQLVILDSNAKVVFYRTLAQPSYDYELHKDGRFSYFYNNKYYLTDGNMQVKDSLVPGNGFVVDEHELDILPNGHYLIMAQEKFVQNLSAYPYFKNIGLPGSPQATLTGVVIQELDTAKNVVFQWKASDHFDFDDVDPFFLFDPALVDWTHSNSVTMDHDGNILLCSRHFNEITKISRTTGNIIWRFGGKKNMFTFIGDTSKFYGIHHARRIADSCITLFDNGRHKISHGARALKYRLDETNLTAELVWDHQPDPTRVSQAMGNVQSFGNKRTLVNYGALAFRTRLFDVVDSAGNEQVRIVFTDSSYSYRSYHISRLPNNFFRPTIVCAGPANPGKLDAGAGYLSYKWNTGDTTRFISPLGPGNYYVMNQRSPGEFVRSYDLHISGNPCSTTEVSEVKTPAYLQVYPNPAAGQLNLNLPEQYSVMVFNTMGQRLFDEEKYPGETSIDVSAWPDGLYLVQFGTQSHVVLVRVVVRN